MDGRGNSALAVPLAKLPMFRGVSCRKAGRISAEWGSSGCFMHFLFRPGERGGYGGVASGECLEAAGDVGSGSELVGLLCSPTGGRPERVQAQVPEDTVYIHTHMDMLMSVKAIVLPC